MNFLQRMVVRANKEVLTRLRSEEADRVMSMPVRHGSLDELRGHKHCLLVTYRKDGRPVAQPVWPGLEDGRMYVWTEVNAYKAKRLHNNPAALVAPCTFRGNPLGASISVRGRVLEAGAASAQAERIIRSGWGWKRRLYERLTRPVTAVVYMEFLPEGADEKAVA